MTDDPIRRINLLNAIPPSKKNSAEFADVAVATHQLGKKEETCAPIHAKQIGNESDVEKLAQDQSRGQGIFDDPDHRDEQFHQSNPLPEAVLGGDSQHGTEKGCVAGAPRLPQRFHADDASRTGEPLTHVFEAGEKVAVWSKSQQSWLDGVVDELLNDSSVFHGHAVPAGAVRVSTSLGTKWIRPEQFDCQLKRLGGNRSSPAFFAGQVVNLRGVAAQEWTEAVIVRVFAEACSVDGEHVQEGTVQVKSSSGRRLVPPQDFERLLCPMHKSTEAASGYHDGGRQA